jgi:hypothetical protein
MIRPWPSIVAYFQKLRSAIDHDGYRVALAGIEQLASFVADGPLGAALFGWTSMHDLCIQQTNTAPYNGPYLRVSPLHSGMIAFRYLDTAIEARQWHRVVPPEGAVGRFTTFLDQLHWVAGTATQHRSDPPARAEDDVQSRELRSNWRRRWLSAIREFAAGARQRRMWLATDHANPSWSYVEFMCGYFDDLFLSDGGYPMAIKRGLVSEREAEAVAHLHDLLVQYSPPRDDAYDHRAILDDPRWCAIMDEAGRAQRALLNLLADPERRVLLGGDDER